MGHRDLLVTRHYPSSNKCSANAHAKRLPLSASFKSSYRRQANGRFLGLRFLRIIKNRLPPTSRKLVGSGAVTVDRSVTLKVKLSGIENVSPMVSFTAPGGNTNSIRPLSVKGPLPVTMAIGVGAVLLSDESNAKSRSKVPLTVVTPN